MKRTYTLRPRSRFPNPPRPPKVSPEIDLGSEPVRPAPLMSTLDITQHTVDDCAGAHHGITEQDVEAYQRLMDAVLRVSVDDTNPKA